MASSCSDSDDDSASQGLEIRVFSPVKVIPGQILTINGLGLSSVTEVSFPGGQTVTSITHYADGQINVVVPSGVTEGPIQVSGGGQTATSRLELEIGNPMITAISPTDEEIKIGAEVMIVGEDMEFFDRAYFPGADGEDVVVKAVQFIRRSTNLVTLNVPSGIKAGTTTLKLEDMSGKSYVTPEITLSDKLSTGKTSDDEIWSGEQVIDNWDWWYLPASDLNLSKVNPQVGMTIRFVFADHNNDATFCVCDGWWGAHDMGGSPDINTITVAAGVTEALLPIDETLLSMLNGVADNAFIIGGSGGLVVTSIEIINIIWKGEAALWWWWYMSPDEVDYTGGAPEAGMTLRFVFAPHDVDGNFCLCDGWWGAPDLGGADQGRDANNIIVEVGRTVVDCVITDQLCTTMTDGSSNPMLIGGGDLVLKRMELHK